MLALWLALALGCLWPTLASAQITRWFEIEKLQAHQIANLSWSDEVVLGQAVDRYLKQDGLVTYGADPALKQYVKRVLETLVAASRYPERSYRVQIVVDEDINAFATMGGYLYLHTGLLKNLHHEAELAAVLAHELGHLEERDGLNQLWHHLTLEAWTFQVDRPQRRLVALSGDLRSLSNGHADEYTADAIAFRLLGQTGYDQSALVQLLQRLADTSQPVSPGWISSHPNPESRLEHLDRLLATESTPSAQAGLDPLAYQAAIASLN